MFSNLQTGKEILKEYCDDLVDLRRQTIEYSLSTKVAQYFQKHRRQDTITLTPRFRTSLNNEYFGVLIYSKDKNSRVLDAYHVGLVDTPRGKCALTFLLSSHNVLQITPHFAERYKERYSKVSEWNTRGALVAAKTFEEIIKIFIIRNHDIIWVETKTAFRNKLHIFAPIPDGVMLLQWDRKRQLLQANTFITYDMLSEKQMWFVEEAYKYHLLTPEERAKLPHPEFIASS